VPGDLHVDPEVLASLRAGLRTAEDRLSTACRELGSFEGLSVGARPIFDELTEFTADWEYGLHRIGRGCAEAVEALDGIAATFTAVDQRLAALLASMSCERALAVPTLRDPTPDAPTPPRADPDPAPTDPPKYPWNPGIWQEVLDR